ncbi:transposase family protein [Geomicrobium sp. JCM 19039]|uniref:transposase family protein n=1 Tax=Geomicrobium sp. JCM 19039 TaxID=1460636 RepID=UPI0027D7F6B7|nr:transposase family protein [Geomicrobium sp. JCM 19039]
MPLARGNGAQETSLPSVREKTNKVHDYQLQKIQHLQLFERNTLLWYRKRRYVCTCGKRIPEACPVVESAISATVWSTSKL